MPGLYNASWEYLDAHVNRLRETTADREIWRIIEEHPIDPKSIDRLLVKRWKIYLVKNLVGFGRCFYHIDSRTIMLDSGLVCYQRDSVLLHEIAHAIYGAELDDCERSTYRRDNNSIAELLGRKARADPKVLRRAILGFGLIPYIYDLPSAEAFYPYPVDFHRQLAFEFDRAYFDGLKATMMDGLNIS